MSRQPGRDLVAPTTMWKRVRRALARCYGWMSRTGGRVRGVLGLIVARRERAVEDSGSIAARARFWDEFRDGQREAEANCPRLDP
jgi:hypothetical protein